MAKMRYRQWEIALHRQSSVQKKELASEDASPGDSKWEA
jgi:hypothetical protein